MSKSSNLMYVLVPHSSGISTGTPQRQAPLAAASVNNGEQGILLVAATVLSGGGSGFPVSILGLTDNADSVAPLDGLTSSLYEGVVSRLTGYDEVLDVWNRVRLGIDDFGPADLGVLADKMISLSRLQAIGIAAEQWRSLLCSQTETDGQGGVANENALMVNAFGRIFNGATWDRPYNNSAANVSAATQPFAQQATSPGEWAVNSEPAVTTQATASRAAGGAGVRHVCRSLHFSLAAVVAQGIVYARVRDGASGAGTILWSQAVVLPAAGNAQIVLSGLNIVGSANTAMTFEWSAAPAATNFQTAGGSGYSTV